MRSHTSRRFRLLLAAAAALCISAPLAVPALAQESASAPASTPSTASTSTEAQPSTATPSTSAPALSNGLPTEPAPPRTLRAYWHVWIAFTLAWLLLFGYVVSVGRRFGKVERELEAMGG
ncbi:MAG: hypothetical protein JWM27_4834 [Gemmatimonadetes bacterium]|nr:hypothetical protein [Gemmatimonadota bacterium]